MSTSAKDQALCLCQVSNAFLPISFLIFSFGAFSKNVQVLYILCLIYKTFYKLYPFNSPTVCSVQKWHYLPFTDKKIYIHTKPDWQVWGKYWAQSPDVVITSCLFVVVAQVCLSHPRVTLKVRHLLKALFCFSFG